MSGHVPACREPAAVLPATLASLARQVDAPRHEILVIVSNAPDPQDWQPVAAFCARQGAPFRFVFCGGVAGAKAGALNIALGALHPDTTNIVTIDADYQVDRTFLRDVRDDLATHDCAFLQYPQAFRHVTAASEGIALEMADYLTRQAVAANLGRAMLLTGTLSVIRKDALERVGGWPTDSCTEDAALGTVLIQNGLHGVCIDKVVGRGLMPLDVAGLHQQRFRWASGNARVLLDFMRKPRGGAMVGLTALRRLLIASQLAAWLNFGAASGAACVNLPSRFAWRRKNDRSSSRDFTSSR